MHEGLIPVVEELNRRGWRTKYWTSRTGRCHPGQPFSKQALLSILKNVAYIGQVSYKGTIYPSIWKLSMPSSPLGFLLAVANDVQRVLQVG